MKTRKSNTAWSYGMIRTIGVSVLTMALGTAGALAQQVTNGDFKSGTFNGTWSELGVQQPSGTLIPQATGWTVSGNGIDCVMMSSNYTAGVGGTPMCGTAYTGPSSPATLTQSPGPVPGGYTGYILVADAYEGTPPGTGGFTEAISQTVTGLTPSTAYSLSFYYSGAQQSGYTGDSADYWKVAYGPSSGTNTFNTTPICIPDAGGAGSGLCAGINSGTPGPVWSQQTFNFTTTASGTGSTQEFISFLAEGNATANGPPFMLLANVNVTKAPEPASIALFGIGLAGLVGLRKRVRATT